MMIHNLILFTKYTIALQKKTSVYVCIDEYHINNKWVCFVKHNKQVNLSNKCNLSKYLRQCTVELKVKKSVSKYDKNKDKNYDCNKWKLCEHVLTIMQMRTATQSKLWTNVLSSSHLITNKQEQKGIHISVHKAQILPMTSSKRERTLSAMETELSMQFQYRNQSVSIQTRKIPTIM